jgi:bacterial/archaeal transporter family-2 protein
VVTLSRVVAALLTLLAGGLVAFQPPANALLGRLVGDLGAAFVSLLFATVIAGVLLLLLGDMTQLGRISGFKPEHMLGGVGGAAIVIVSLITVRTLGASGVTAALVAGQLIVSAVLDRYGVLGLEKTALGWQGWTGVVLLLGGTFLLTGRP